MISEDRIDQWTASYRELADKVVATHVRAMHEEFPDERFPVRPPYRRAMYHRLTAIVDELNSKMKQLLAESPDEASEQLEKRLMSCQEEYEQEFIRQVRKEEAGDQV